MRKHIQFPTFLHNDATGREVSRLRQVDSSNAVAVAEVFKIQRRAAGKLDRLLRKQSHRGVLFQASVLRDEFAFLAQAALGDRDLLEHIVDRDGYAEIWIAFSQLVDVVPLVGVVDHVEKRQQLFFFAVAQKKTSRSLDQLVIYRIVYISRSRAGQKQAFRPRAHC